MEKKKNRNISMSELRARKKKLQQELEDLEDDIEGRFSGVQKKILGNIDPISIIKKNPLKSVGTSVLFGLAIGMIGRKNKEGISDKSGRGEFTDQFLSEMKRVAAKKVAHYLSELINRQVSGDES